MSFVRYLIAASVVSALAAHAAEAPPGFDTLQQSALAAYSAKDYPRMERELRAALLLRPNQPRALYNLAAAEALQNHADAALADLTKLERQKLAYNIAADSDFATVKNDARFKTLADKFTAHRAPRGNAGFGFSGGVQRFIPEGIAYDEYSDSFYLSSVRERRVLRFDADRNRSNLVRPGAKGLMSAMGMVIDDKKRKLWVASAALPEMEDYDESKDAGKSAVYAFDRRGGSMRDRLVLPADGHAHVFGDLALEPKSHTLYVTDSAYGMLYGLSDTGVYTPLTAPGALVSPQGLSLSADGQRIYLADYAQGLFRFDIPTRALTKLKVADDINLYGIDGLYRHRDTLIGVQNGIKPNRIVRIRLDKADTQVTSMEVLLSNHPDFDEPAGGVIVRNKYFYFIANSQWNRIAPNHRVPPSDELRRPVVLRINLDNPSKTTDDPIGNGRNRGEDAGPAQQGVQQGGILDSVGPGPSLPILR